MASNSHHCSWSHTLLVAAGARYTVTRPRHIHSRTRVSGYPRSTYIRSPLTLNPPSPGFLIRTKGTTSGKPAADGMLLQREELRASKTQPSPLSPNPSQGVTQNILVATTGPDPRQQHTLFLANKAQQLLEHCLPPGPSLKPDTGSAWGIGDKGPPRQLLLCAHSLCMSPCLQTTPLPVSARRDTCPFTAISSADVGCHPRTQAQWAGSGHSCLMKP